MNEKPSNVTILTSPDVLGEGWVVVFNGDSGELLRVVEPDESIVGFLSSILVSGTDITRLYLSARESGLTASELGEWWESVEDDNLPTILASAERLKLSIAYL